MTTLNLLTRDGLVTCTFDRPLEEEHYAELYTLIHKAETKAEMHRVLEAFAERVGLKIICE